MLSTENVAFQYNSERGFLFPQLQCKAGEILLVTGQSGCGKTTLLHLLAGILHTNQGKININNTDINTLSSVQKDAFRAKNIGLVYQKAHFLAALTVLDNLKLPGWLGHSKQDTKTILGLADRLGVAHTLKRLPSKLSIGEQQRISIIRAVINHPSLLLADEPTSALDDQNCDEVYHLLSEMAAQQGSALVIVTHDGRLKEKIKHRVDLNV
jgi:ABC-type lipoprotein export system ATPase subunit